MTVYGEVRFLAGGDSFPLCFVVDSCLLSGDLQIPPSQLCLYEITHCHKEGN